MAHSGTNFTTTTATLPDLPTCEDCGRLKVDWSAENYYCWWCKERTADGPLSTE